MRSWCWGLVLAVIMLLAPADALSYTTPSGLTPSSYATVCPPRPGEPAEGATVSEQLLTTIAQELADSCYRREQLGSQAHTDAGAIATRLGEPLSTTVLGDPEVSVSNWASAPSSSTVEFSSTAKATVDGDVQALHDDAWFLVGALIALAAGLVLYAEIRPRR